MVVLRPKFGGGRLRRVMVVVFVVDIVRQQLARTEQAAQKRIASFDDSYSRQLGLDEPRVETSHQAQAGERTSAA